MFRVSKHYLILMSGFAWALIGAYLLFMGSNRIAEFSLPYSFLFISIAIILGLLKAKYIFFKIVQKNMNRINSYEAEKVSVWAFQKWTSYALIIAMMLMGILIRDLNIFPNYILSPLYLAIGLALLVSSILYFKSFFKN